MKFQICTLILVSGILTDYLFADDKDNSSNTKVQCLVTYDDKSVQDKPLYTDSFAVDIESREPVEKKYGVSPSDGDYYAVVTANVGLITVMILNEKSGAASIASADVWSKLIKVAHRLNDRQVLNLTCLP